MARQRKASDDIYNARRRFRREAERAMKKAETATGVEKARYETQAKYAVGKALATYSPKAKDQGKVGKLASQLGVTRSTVYAQTFLQSYKSAKGGLTRSGIAKAIEASYSALSSNVTSRDQMARDILSIGNVGSRFYGGLVEVWGKDEDSRQHPNKAILDYFGKASIMDVIEELEAAGIDIYSTEENDKSYKSAQLKLQEYILTHREG